MLPLSIVNCHVPNLEEVYIMREVTSVPTETQKVSLCRHTRTSKESFSEDCMHYFARGRLEALVIVVS